MRRVLAVIAIFAGTAIVGFNPNRWDYVVLDLPRQSHGIHLHDLVGLALVLLGVVVLWYSPRS